MREMFEVGGGNKISDFVSACSFARNAIMLAGNGV